MQLVKKQELKNVRTNNSGEILRSEKEYFGGGFSMWEKLMKKGVGSPKVIYEKGIEEFDKLKRGVEGEVGFVNFEILKNGLILRVNQNQRRSCVGVRIDEVEKISLVGYRIEIKQRRFGKLETRIVHRGELKIIESNGVYSEFSILVSEFESLVDFFRRQELVGKFDFFISEDPPEKDNGYLLEMIEGIF